MEPPRRPGRIAAPAPGGGKSWSGLSGAGCLGGGGVDPWAAMLVRREGLRKEAEVERLAGPGRVGMGAAQGARTGRVQGGLGGRVGVLGLVHYRCRRPLENWSVGCSLFGVHGIGGWFSGRAGRAPASGGGGGARVNRFYWARMHEDEDNTSLKQNNLLVSALLLL